MTTRTYRRQTKRTGRVPRTGSSAIQRTRAARRPPVSRRARALVLRRGRAGAGTPPSSSGSRRGTGGLRGSGELTFLPRLETWVVVIPRKHPPEDAQSRLAAPAVRVAVARQESRRLACLV